MKNRLIQLVYEKAFRYSEEPTFKLVSGRMSNYYFNCKTVTLHPEGMYLIGNIERGAMIKLEAFGLDRYFEIGAYGNDDADRNRLLPIVREKLRNSRSLNVDYRDCIVIGDTPRDVECAKPYGAYSIAVATGPYTYSSLEAAGADAVFCDFSDTASFLNIVENKREKIVRRL